MRVTGRAVLLAIAGALAFPAAALAVNDIVTPELTAAYNAVLANPMSRAANLRYAQLAEQYGENRKALTTYERMLVNDPNDGEAAVALERIRRKLEPTGTQFTFEVGAGYESNPRLLPNSFDDDVKVETALTARSEANVFDQRWRSTITGVGEYFFDTHDLNYGSAGITLGPLLDIGPKVTIQPFVGGSAATLAGLFYYGEGVAGLQAEGYLNGAYQLGRVRAGYRQYGDSWTSDKGYYADATAKLSFPHVLMDGDLVVLQPTFRWSDMGGTSLDFFFDEIQPGKYWQWSGEAGYYKTVFDWITLGASVKVGQTYYGTDVTPSGDQRVDLLVSPGASIVFAGILGAQRDFKIDYHADITNSNDDSHDSVDHVATARVIARF